MRTFFWFLGLFLLAFAAMAAFAYPAWTLLHPHFSFPFHRIAARIGMLALLAGFIAVARRLGLADRASLGYGVPRKTFLREFALALSLGVVLMLAIVAAMVSLGLRQWQPGLEISLPTVLRLTVQGLMSGVTVALIEETFLRGAMYSGIARESGVTVAIALTSIVYAATHFIARYRIPPELVSAWSGVDMVRGSLHEFADPGAIADAFLALLAVGVLLGMVRAATGNIAACIGLHAGWVWVIALVSALSAADRTRTASFLLSRFDGFVGWLVLAWTLAIGFPLYRFYLRRGSLSAQRAPSTP